MLKRQILNRIKQRDNGETVMNLFPIVISSIVLSLEKRVGLV